MLSSGSRVVVVALLWRAPVDVAARGDRPACARPRLDAGFFCPAASLVTSPTLRAVKKVLGAEPVLAAPPRAPFRTRARRPRWTARYEERKGFGNLYLLGELQTEPARLPWY